MKGRFITFEGIDGTGKSTQVELLAKKMREEGYDLIVTKEPGSPVDPSHLGLQVRQILFHTVTTHAMCRGVADCLLLADHIQHVGKVVEPALAEGKTVISDRFADSEFAYAVAKNTPGFMLDAYAAAFGPVPDITVLFVASDPAVMLARARARRGETHQSGKTWDDVDQQIAIQREYLSRLVGQGRTIVLNVSPEMTPVATFEILWQAISSVLSRPVEYYEGEHYKVITVPGIAGQID
jgi:dTMP kinase